MPNDYILERPAFDGATDIIIAHSEHLLSEAKLATELVERWGLIAATENGMDDAGRAKFRLQTPEELVARSCLTAELLMAEIRKRNWVQPLPAPKLAREKTAEELREMAERAEERMKKMLEKMERKE